MACRKRNVLLNLCVVQLIITIWRQLFDYLGFMWGPILINFFHMIFVIFGFFGAWQFKYKYLLCFLLWSILWFGWNLFLNCFYLNVGSLDRESDLLSLGTGSVSWWEINGPGCKALYLSNTSGIESDPWRPHRPDLISGCVIPYHYLEIAQAVIHCFLAILSLYFSCVMISSIKNGEPNHTTKKMKMPSLYSTEYVADRNSGGDSIEEAGGSCRPMTPRRVKRRSVRQGSSRHGSLRRSGRHGSSRSSRRRVRPHSLPPSVSSSTLLDQHTLLHPNRYQPQYSGTGQTNCMYQPTSTHSLVDEERPPSARSSYSNFHGMRGDTFRQSSRQQFFASGPPGYTSETGV